MKRQVKAKVREERKIDKVKKKSLPLPLPLPDSLEV